MKNVLALLKLRDRNGVLYGASVVDIHDVKSFIGSVLDAQTFSKALDFADCDLIIDCLQNVEDGALCREYGSSCDEFCTDMEYKVRRVYDKFDIADLPEYIQEEIKEFLSDVEE